MDPTYDGFVAWVSNIMGVPAASMPSSDVLQYAYDEALNVVYFRLEGIPSIPCAPSLYAQAVYNLAGDYLVRIAQDTPPSTFWSDLRSTLNINSFSFGIVDAAADQGTSTALMVPKQLQDLTLANLLTLKTPWGQQYLAIVSSWGYEWGITY